VWVRSLIEVLGCLFPDLDSLRVWCVELALTDDLAAF
jgi:hypothetical protein